MRKIVMFSALLATAPVYAYDYSTATGAMITESTGAFGDGTAVGLGIVALLIGWRVFLRVAKSH